MIDESIILDIIKNLLNDKKASKSPDLPSIVFALLRPFAGKRKKNSNFPPEIGMILDKTIREKGYCTNCRVRKFEKKTDSTCTICKKQIKNLCKKKLQDNFDSL